MFSVKRLLYLLLIVAALGVIFLTYNANEDRMFHFYKNSRAIQTAEFTSVRKLDEMKKQKIYLVGSVGAGEPYGAIFENVKRLCEYLHLYTETVEGALSLENVRTEDRVIFATRRATSMWTAPH